MSRIRGRDTRPEMLLRRGLHARGFRFRLHQRDLPGRPDLVFPKHRVCVFVHGCFWHGHDCAMFKLPKTRKQFWEGKIAGNHRRDEQAVASLIDDGWSVLVVWECALRGPGRLGIDTVLSECIEFIHRAQRSSSGASVKRDMRAASLTSYREISSTPLEKSNSHGADHREKKISAVQGEKI